MIPQSLVQKGEKNGQKLSLVEKVRQFWSQQIFPVREDCSFSFLTFPFQYLSCHDGEMPTVCSQNIKKGHMNVFYAMQFMYLHISCYKNYLDRMKTFLGLRLGGYRMIRVI